MDGINFLKHKKLRVIFPLTYLRQIFSEVNEILTLRNVFNRKSFPLDAFSRLFGTNRRLVVNVLVLVSDLENNAGAACLELISNENPEIFKRWGYRPPDNNFDLFNDNHFDINDIGLMPDLVDESRILDANLRNLENGNDDVNPNYLMQISLSSNNSNRNLVCNDEKMENINNLYVKSDENVMPVASCSSNAVSMLRSLQTNQLNHNTSSATSSEKDFISNSSDQYELHTTRTQSTSSYVNEDDYKYEHQSDDENNDCYEDYDDDEDYDLGDDISGAHAIPKPILREIRQLRNSGIPYDYRQITVSSHEQFKLLRSNPKLTKKQVNLMVNTRRRYINRRAATRCRNQKLQAKDNLNDELKRLQQQLVQAQISLNKTYQKRNDTRDEFRRLQNRFIPRLIDINTNDNLTSKRWSVELNKTRSNLLIRELKPTSTLPSLDKLSKQSASSNSVYHGFR